MKINSSPPFWLATPLSFAALHAIVVLGALLLLMTPFAFVGSLLYRLVMLVDILALQFWDGEAVTTILVLGSLQWFLIGLFVATVARWIERLAKRSA